MIWIDYIIILTIIFFSYFGFINGCIYEIFSFTLTWLTFSFFKNYLHFLMYKELSLINIIKKNFFFVIQIIIILFIIKIINNFLYKTIYKTKTKFINKLLGSFIGLLKGILIISTLIYHMYITFYISKYFLWKKSLLIPEFYNFLKFFFEKNNFFI